MRLRVGGALGLGPVGGFWCLGFGFRVVGCGSLRFKVLGCFWLLGFWVHGLGAKGGPELRILENYEQSPWWVQHLGFRGQV